MIAAAAGIVLIALVLYAVFGGADFGGGVWDLLASGPRREAQRAAVTVAIGPVWEANHVWLIFAIVALFTCFPQAFADVAIGLYAPLSLALFGIVLRGAAFAFRHYAGEGATARTWTVVFGIASLLTPFFLGDAVGGLATGTYAWTAPFAFAVGLFAVAVCAQIAAIFLLHETGDPALVADFRRRAVRATLAVWVLGLVPAALAAAGGLPIFGALQHPAAAFSVVVALVAGIAAIVAVRSRADRAARIAVAVEAIAILAAWFGAQGTNIVPGRPLLAVAAPQATLTAFVIACVIGASIVGPSLALLFRVFKAEPPKRRLMVLIVGAGPVGLALAGDLAARGQDVTILERGNGRIEQPRMDLVGIRTMEFCRRWGLVGAVETSAYNRNLAQDNVYVTSLAGYELGRERFPSMNASRPPPQSPQKRERCPQDMFDPILRAWAESFPNVKIKFRHELVGFTEDADRVRAHVVERETRRGLTFEAPFLVGCDGAASVVAKTIGGAPEGTPVLSYTTNIIFRAPQLLSLHDKGEAYRYVIVGPEGTWATIVAINGFDRWRMSIVRTPPAGATRPQVEAAIRRAVGLDFAFEILSITSWTRRELVASSYGTGRAYIAGDAAHVMSPTGGFGMNTGVGDAVDLSWKLDAVVRGWGGPALLASYTTERRPVAVFNARESSANFGRMLSPGENPALCDATAEGAAVRAVVGPALAAAMRREWFTLGVHLGYRYDDSPVCWPDAEPAPPQSVAAYDQEARAGARAPHAWLGDGRSTLDLFGDGFTLLRFTAGAPAEPIADALRARGVPVRTVELANEPAAVAAYATPLCLVRPDGHVAWRGTAVGEAELLADCVRGAAPYAWRTAGGLTR